MSDETKAAASFRLKVGVSDDMLTPALAAWIEDLKHGRAEAQLTGAASEPAYLLLLQMILDHYLAERGPEAARDHVLTVLHQRINKPRTTLL